MIGGRGGSIEFVRRASVQSLGRRATALIVLRDLPASKTADSRPSATAIYAPFVASGVPNDNEPSDRQSIHSGEGGAIATPAGALSDDSRGNYRVLGARRISLRRLFNTVFGEIVLSSTTANDRSAAQFGVDPHRQSG